MFKFEEVRSYPPGTGLKVFREITTDCLFVRFDGPYRDDGPGGLTQMFDPSTGKPLTYTNWKEKYQKNLKL